MKKHFGSTFLLILLLSQLSQGQTPAIRYVDFHIHTSMKNYYRDIPVPDSVYDAHFISKYRIDTANWSGTKHRKHFCKNPGFSGFYGKGSFPEASWDMLSSSPASIMCTSITPIEKRFVSDKRVRVIPGIRAKMRCLNKLFVTKLDLERQDVIYRHSSFEEFMAEYHFMQLQNPAFLDFRPIRLIKDSNDLADALKKNEVAIILTVEGAHSFFGKSTVCAEDNFAKDCGLNEYTVNEVWKNLDSVKALPNHVFFVTPGHMTWNGLFSQAKSLDIDKKILRALLQSRSNEKKFRAQVFKKYHNGIVDSILEYNRPPDKVLRKKLQCNCHDPILSYEKGYGYEFISRLLDKSNGKHRILIDMRHMDVQSRMDYINLVDSLRKISDSIPLIISHAAVNGKSYNQAKMFGSCPFADRYDEVRNPKKFYTKYDSCFSFNHVNKINLNQTGWFHPFSINLFDEEIQKIYSTNGIIGITLEERVLGKNRYNYTCRHYKDLKNRCYKKIDDDNKFTYEDLKITEPFMRNLLYIIEHSGYAGTPKSWENVALGSDFDGQINPIDVCSKATDIPNFYQMLATFLPAYAKYLGKEDLLINQPVTILLNKLFYENGERFITRYFK